ncbi:flavin reductase family protein [Aquisalibacillus elongatus]|uniref:Flavin reductase (DIM6/NTAB) family NADH-FMN oxidoreductase RutF n=1 Tax=Aquisalibacillus elongatus TaxID=485577 RepID=A0A3N5B483_9BACI|nr:flavin reductase family protein [Aquisalibacillus elongatus]RPF52087.1 flavin reductase (DIM6/NTAB) family NADH-FMN oxidoreductase RutF [Aquisalibacillus elongatus]
MDHKEFRNCLGRFATGVTVVTCDNQDECHGLTANAFTSVSLDPPLVLVSIDRNTKAYHKLKNNRFIINILSAEQQNTALHFAGKTFDKQPFEWAQSEFGYRIKDSLAYIECEPWAEYDGGDHVLFLGKVHDFDYLEGEPLGFYGGKFSKIVQDL